MPKRSFPISVLMIQAILSLSVVVLFYLVADVYNYRVISGILPPYGCVLSLSTVAYYLFVARIPFRSKAFKAVLVLSTVFSGISLGIVWGYTSGLRFRFKFDPSDALFFGIFYGLILYVLCYIEGYIGSLFLKKKTDYPECSQCGYNLTGNVSGRCPECGNQMKEISINRLYKLYVDALEHCTSDILKTTDVEIEHSIFEEFEIGVGSFHHEYSLSRLLAAGLIDEEIVCQSQDVRRRGLALVDSKGNVEAIKNDPEWLSLMKDVENLLQLVYRKQRDSHGSRTK